MALGKILVAKLGLDGHDRGARVVARLLRDAGFEVIYTGMRQTPEAVVQAALQEDVDLIGISILSGSHNALVTRTLDLLQEAGLADVPVVVGGIIPAADVVTLTQAGVAAVFGPDARDAAMIKTITQLVQGRSAASRP